MSGRVRSAFGGWLRMLAYPLSRPLADLRGTAQKMREAARSVRQHRELNQEANKAVDGLLKPFNPQQRFEEMAAALNWTEPELRSQAVAARRARVGSVAAGVSSFGLIGWAMLLSGGWILLVLASVAVVLVVGTMLQAMRHAWWEFQLEQRALIPFRTFVCRDDLLRRLVGWR
jgi:hypothetical protein